MISFIPTPIWNKEDITIRALRILKESELLLCEDTRTTIKLLRMYDIEYRTKTLHSYTSYSSEEKISQIILSNKYTSIWVVSEAGTPWLSDPGKSIIKLCWDYSLPFEILPWANALIPAVIATPTNTSTFVYMWFVPQKKGRITFLKNILQCVNNDLQPVYMYESVHRVQKLLTQLQELWYAGNVSIARELTKLYEQYLTWTPWELLEFITTSKLQLKGEFVIWLYS